jgi:hypothetical protein
VAADKERGNGAGRGSQEGKPRRSRKRRCEVAVKKSPILKKPLIPSHTRPLFEKPVQVLNDSSID